MPSSTLNTTKRTPGATPWYVARRPAPLPPIKPATCVPWPKSSEGSARRSPDSLTVVEGVDARRQVDRRGHARIDDRHAHAQANRRRAVEAERRAEEVLGGRAGRSRRDGVEARRTHDGVGGDPQDPGEQREGFQVARRHVGHDGAEGRVLATNVAAPGLERRPQPGPRPGLRSHDDAFNLSRLSRRPLQRCVEPAMALGGGRRRSRSHDRQHQAGDPFSGEERGSSAHGQAVEQSASHLGWGGTSSQ